MNMIYYRLYEFIIHIFIIIFIIKFIAYIYTYVCAHICMYVYVCMLHSKSQEGYKVNIKKKKSQSWSMF